MVDFLELAMKQKEPKEKKEVKKAEVPVASKQKKKMNVVFNFAEHPIIILLWGMDGTSKSEQILKFEPKENTIILDLEDKLRPLAAKLEFPQLNIINAKQYNDLFDIDGPKTLYEIRDLIQEIKKCKLHNKGKFAHIETVAMDGISDVRPYAIIEWLEENPSRKRPNTPGDWRQINDKVRDIIFSLINMGLSTKTNIFLTAQVGYRDDKEIPDCKPWVWHNIQHKFKLSRDDTNHRFYAFCEKSHFDPFWTMDLTDFTHSELPSLMNLLKEPEKIKEYQELYKQTQLELAKNKANSML